ncbi:MAG: dTMP kinase [Magnetococcales bacterium]|nr:dTMP kinase [Magnetococcales bacterium]
MANNGPHQGNGALITFEGGEGSGKSTQIQYLARRLEGCGITVVQTREPGGCPMAESIRALLVTGEPGAMLPETELLLMLAARAEHVRRVILPALARGAWVICDRYMDSSVVYQGFGRGLDRVQIQAFNRWVVAGAVPVRTFLLDIDPQAGLERTQRREDAADSHDINTPSETRFERDSRGFHERVRQGFLTLAQQEPGRFLRLNAGQSPEALSQQIWEALRELDGFPE